VRDGVAEGVAEAVAGVVEALVAVVGVVVVGGRTRLVVHPVRMSARATTTASAARRGRSGETCVINMPAAFFPGQGEIRWP
jgi:hypothetical protein